MQISELKGLNDPFTIENSENFQRVYQVFKSRLRVLIKVARYSFSGPIPPKFEHKLRRHKQSFGKIAGTVVLDEGGNLL